MQHIVSIWVKIVKLKLWLKSILRVQLELLVNYYSSNLARKPIKTHKDDEKWPLFVNKQVVRINNIGQ